MQELIDDWSECVKALEIADKLNNLPVLRAQADAYTLAINAVTAGEGVVALGETVSTLEDSIRYLPKQSEYLQAVIDTLLVCKAAINRTKKEEA